MVTQRFAVEFDRRTVGVAVRVPGGFMFYASPDGRFDEMDGRLFPRARAIERQLTKVAKRHKRRTSVLDRRLPPRDRNTIHAFPQTDQELHRERHPC